MPYTSTNPFTEETLETYPDQSDANLEDLLTAAASAFQGWRGRMFAERAAVIRRAALKLAVSQIEAAVSGGATLLMGGRRLDRRGWFMAPAILTGVARDHPAFHEEFFAPVAMVFRAADDDEAISIANDSPSGLGGSVAGSDIAHARRVADRMDTGMVFINDTVVSMPELPFGGVRDSGFGRELSSFGIQEFVSKKPVFIAPQVREAA